MFTRQLAGVLCAVTLLAPLTLSFSADCVYAEEPKTKTEQSVSQTYPERIAAKYYSGETSINEETYPTVFKAFRCLTKDCGLTATVACAILGNAMAETGNGARDIDPSSLHDNVVGFVQWTGCADTVISILKTYYSPYGAWSDIIPQCRLLTDELKHVTTITQATGHMWYGLSDYNSRATGFARYMVRKGYLEESDLHIDNFLKQTDLAKATAAFLACFEDPIGCDPEGACEEFAISQYNRRYDFAKAVYRACVLRVS